MIGFCQYPITFCFVPFITQVYTLLFVIHKSDTVYPSSKLPLRSSNGKPENPHALYKLIEENELSPIVFHSLRHSSITYKLKLTGGDMKAVQGDSGHSRVKMVADVYSHIIDEDRKNNAELFEEPFYRLHRQQKSAGDPASNANQAEMIKTLTEHPEVASLLSTLLKQLQ